MKESKSPLVLYEVADGVATITLNRPEKLNALSLSLYVDLDAALMKMDADPAVRAAVITGAGRCFSVGADIGADSPLKGILDIWEKRYLANDQRQFTLWQIGKPIIAAVHGYCIGRGLELALWCDIVVASEDARLGQPEVRQGSFVATLVPFLVGPHRAKLFMMMGEQIEAKEAEKIGLVTQVVPSGQALSEAVKLARRLAHVPPVTARAIKRWINGIYEQMGVRSAQTSGAAIATLIANLTPKESETEELERIRLEKGFKAFLEARDAPFRK